MGGWREAISTYYQQTQIMKDREVLCGVRNEEVKDAASCVSSASSVFCQTI